jgi:RNA polymerase sigma-70 factor (ECF subfamily)
VQETYLRAWARLDTFAGRAPFRAWLYGIATHTCLDALRRRKARVWPTDVSAPADPARRPTPPVELPWLLPYPDRLLDAPAPQDAEPEAVVTSKETIELAFLPPSSACPRGNAPC